MEREGPRCSKDVLSFSDLSIERSGLQSEELERNKRIQLMEEFKLSAGLALKTDKTNGTHWRLLSVVSQ